ncbi:DUF1015 domain-containing protein [Candidatus Acetothermia bacterium]|nr:DUF1015 domain-containing protein [Candidatus Acetothermia bacterium]MCI2427170.1 DUF1015 domain-containing protein [Candidatus Acetothermia bacterium]MCI2428070.1 DUF1015 domain-containing protein [Candidatus Acetothermia bacterium]
MAKIFPFHGITYSLKKIDDLTSVVTPPYDQIDLQDQEKFYQRHPYNIVRIIKGKVHPHDDETDNRYTRAAAYLAEWRRKGIFVRAAQPALYAYYQEYNLQGITYLRKGFVALVELKPSGAGMRGHEMTLAEPKADRLNLIRATQANFGHIFMLYSDPERRANQVIDCAIVGQEPGWQALDSDGNRHMLWEISDTATIATLQRTMTEKVLYIADGHHRYETAVTFMEECRAAGWQAIGAESFHCRMMTMINMNEPGLIILPTHRVIRNLSDFDRKGFLNHLAGNFVVEEIASLSEIRHLLAQRKEGEHLFGLYMGKNNFYLLRLRNEQIMDEIIKDRSPEWKRLDVTILHQAILEPLLGIDAVALREQTSVDYVRDSEQAIAMVQAGSHQLAFIMNPTTIDEVRIISDLQEKMPQKSTDFYPKLLTGLVMTQMEIDRK